MLKNSYASFTGEPFLPNDVSVIISGLQAVSLEQVGDFFNLLMDMLKKLKRDLMEILWLGSDILNKIIKRKRQRK